MTSKAVLRVWFTATSTYRAHFLWAARYSSEVECTFNFLSRKAPFIFGTIMPPKSGAAAVRGKKKCSISDSDAKNLQKIFSEYDADGSGEISILELQHFFAKSPDL